MGFIGGEVGVTDAQVAKGLKQVREDFKAAATAFSIPGTEQDFKSFCLGVTMAVLTLKGYAEEPSLRPKGMTMGQAVEAYYEAARRTLHAD